MFRVGLTGNIASGKSSVARTWARLGAHVIDADVLARRAVEPGTPGLEAIREAFGDGVIRDGALDRGAMRRRVFSDPAARKRLESIVHPEVGRLRAEAEAALAADGAAVVVHDIPLLYEVGLQDTFDAVVVVDAPAELRADRLAAARGLSPSEIRDVMGSQMPAEEKRRRADIVIENAGTMAALESEAERVWRTLERRAGRRDGGAARPASPEGSGGSGRIRVDMHLHTRASFDSLNDPHAVVERARAEGLDRICVTDHNELETALALTADYPDYVIPGEEVKTAERVDVIGLFLSERIPAGTPARETCQRIREQGGLVYVPHPFAGGKGGGGRILPEIEDLVHAVEGFNARLHDPSLNERAERWGRERGLPLGAGSDAHTLGELGHAWVDMPACENRPEAFLAALAEGTLHGRTSSRLVHIASTLAKLVP
jgi:dephospho-CoA kinase